MSRQVSWSREVNYYALKVAQQYNTEENLKLLHDLCPNCYFILDRLFMVFWNTEFRKQIPRGLVHCADYIEYIGPEFKVIKDREHPIGSRILSEKYIPNIIIINKVMCV